MDQENPSKPSPRVPLGVDVEFRKNYARQADKAIIKNISLTGAFLEHAVIELQQRDKILLTLSVGGRTRRISASVIWCSPQGAGIRFNHFNNKDLQLIDDLIYFVENSRDKKRSVLTTIFNKVS